MFERGVQKGWGGVNLGVIRVFKFRCLKWPILSEMTVKYAKYFIFSCQQGIFSCQQGGGGYLPCGGGGGCGNPGVSATLHPFISKGMTDYFFNFSGMESGFEQA